MATQVIVSSLMTMCSGRTGNGKRGIFCDERFMVRDPDKEACFPVIRRSIKNLSWSTEIFLRRAFTTLLVVAEKFLGGAIPHWNP
jgi:hypothetical protein